MHILMVCSSALSILTMIRMDKGSCSFLPHADCYVANLNVSHIIPSLAGVY